MASQIVQIKLNTNLQYFIVTSTSQHQIFDEKFDQGPESVRIKMADLVGRWNQKGSKKRKEETPHPDQKKKKRH